MGRKDNDWTGVDSIEKIYDEKCLTHTEALKLLKEGVGKENFLLTASNYLKYFVGNTILVIGCSIGNEVWAYKENGFNSYGIDISKFAIDNAMPEIKNRCEVADIRHSFTTHSFSSKNKQYGYFDNVTAFDVLEHIPDIELEQSLINCRKMTRKVFVARIPSHYDKPFFCYNIKEIKSEHMIEQSVEYWTTQLDKVFSPIEWNKLIEKPTKDNWWIYRYERIELDKV